ncbi:MAG: histidine phosphatase family protein [Acidobacteriota bacterium]|nr:histidine phosphatase family protein [Acidobacteriota bacterium]MDE3147162.1 histidine phosphatase family protein [Acidobacteriota bacterium]
MIILIRHGQSTTNELGLLVGRSDPPLTARGREQASRLSSHLINVREVWSSPLERARDTARLAVPSLEAQVKEAFIEVDYGSLDGESLSSISDEQWRDFEGDHRRPLLDGESLDAVDQRVHTQLESLLADPTSALHHDDEHLVIVSHVSPIKSAITWALGVNGSAAWRMRIDNGSMTVIATRRLTPSLIRANVVPL